MSDVFISLKNITLKREDRYLLKHIDLTMHSHEIHGIVGNYSSGKDHLINILRGELKPSSGSVVIKGKHYSSLSSREAISNGIAVLRYMDPAMENIKVKEFLGSQFPPRRSLYFSKHEAEAHFDYLAKKYNFDFGKDTLIANVSAADRYYLMLVRLIECSPKLIILDEILDKLSSRHLSQIVSLLHQMKKNGIPTLIITNNIDEIYTIADRVSILKNGKIIFNNFVQKIEKINLIKLAYAEISKFDREEDADEDFYRLLRYNEAVLWELPLNLLIVDRNLQIKIANKNAIEFFSLGQFDYLNLPLQNLFEENEHVYHHLKNVLETQEAEILYNITLRFQKKRFIINIKTYPILDGPDFIGCIVVIEDTTAHEINRDKLFLSENLASVGLLSAGVAHEINNPLEIISNCTSYLSYHINDTALTEKINSIELEVRSISKIISDLKTVSHPRAFQEEDFDVVLVVRQLLTLIDYKAREKHILIELSHENPHYFVKADITEIKQVVLNLVKNSIECIDHSGAIRISLSEVDNDTLQLVVCDSGPGLDEELIKNIFLPFYSTKSDAGENQGLGLYITYGIVSKYNGTIFPRNLHPGCEFTVQLPILVND